MDKLAEIESRLTKATPRPWEADVTMTGSIHVQQKGDESGSKVVSAIGYMGSKLPEQALADADFIGHAPDDIAWLITEVNRLNIWIRELLQY